MRDLISSWTGVTAVVGAVAFLVFVLPTPSWIGWPALVVSIAALGRVIIVGDRRHRELRQALDLDSDEQSTESRADDLVQFLSRDQRPD